MNPSLMTRVLVMCLFLSIWSFKTVEAQDVVAKNKDVSIGLLINDYNELEATFAANYAVRQINAKGGIHGRSVKLVTRSVEGTWGTGSNEVVHMVFQDKVEAILGSIDGRNSHLAEQVIAKTQVLYVSTWASDPTLTQAYVPWYFSLVPTDDQQAEQFYNLLDNEKKSYRVLVLYDQSYDASQALSSFKKLSEKHKRLDLDEIKFESQEITAELKSRLLQLDYDAILLLGKDLPLSSVFQVLQDENVFLPVYVNSHAMSSMDFKLVKNLLKDQLINPNYIQSTTSEFSNLQTQFIDTYNRESGLIAAKVYDGLMMIAEGLKQAGSESEKLKNTVSGIKFQGVTGDIQFDSNGKLIAVHKSSK